MIGVIADDLTGAAEIGAIGLRHGLRAEIIQSGEPSRQMDIVCVDTNSRSCLRGDACSRVAIAARILRSAGARWIYKKVDSVLRGHVTAEIEIAMRELQLESALLIPANPSLGRIIRQGKYFIRGKLIHKTAFGRDPEYPRRSSQVLQLLNVPEEFSIRVVNGDRRLFNRTIVVGEVGKPHDVSEWAAICSADILPAGGADFFDALLDRENVVLREQKRALVLPTACCELFVCGTSTESSRKFVAAARKNKLPVFTLPHELIWGAQFSAAAIESVTRHVISSFGSHSRVILTVGLPLVRNSAVARQLYRNVVEIAQGVITEVPISHIFAEGGATSAELVRRLGWSRLTVVREWEAGVVTLATGDNQAVLLTIKPGSYSWPAEWTECPVIC